ncbi:hypothetical protein [Mesorhizobium sp. ES1-3]|uniref:hypothetical protein n=1 Tax=Mesorhizobium sp. ES1-3 TaxID=2876628 RepID=UPI001CCBB2EF|nr:hypothetical protein [Mesorhizobium sp. ES1-3]MBZ9672868.1 hypothetical protein [Mesorhizobium sp. ES1-3]
MSKLTICCQSSSAGSKQRLSIGIVASKHGRVEKDIETMRNSTLLLAVFAGLAGFALPAAAASDEETCGVQSSGTPPGPIDLQAIPMQDTTATKAIKGIGDVECDGNHLRERTALVGEDEGDALGDDD